MGKIYLGGDEKLQKMVEGVLTGREKIPLGQAEDFVLDAIECKDPRCIELVVGYHLDVGVNYATLVERAHSRGLTNAAGWLLDKARHAISVLGKEVPMGLDNAIRLLEESASQEEYNMTPFSPGFNPQGDETARRWKVIAPRGNEGIIRGVLWSYQDREKSRELIS